MEKIKITPEQANAIEVRLIDEGLDSFINKHWMIYYGNSQKLAPLDELSLAELSRALFIGYEVEEQFSVGDWVAHKTGGTIGKIVEITRGGRELYADNGMGGFVGGFRHATPGEEEREKERRVDQKLDDLLKNLTNNERVRLHEKFESGDYA